LFRPEECEVTSWSSSQVATYLIHSKVEAIPLSSLPKDTTSELAGLTSTHTFHAERYAIIHTIRADKGIEPRFCDCETDDKLQHRYKGVQHLTLLWFIQKKDLVSSYHKTFSTFSFMCFNKYWYYHGQWA